MTQPDNNPSHDDRESLSALFDGELDAGAARFAHRRLGHDPQWREACGRWQLAGDVLRQCANGERPGGVVATGFAEPGFADRVALALEVESVQAARVIVGHAPRRRWIPGAALAASVAVAALFVVRPVSEPEPGPGLAPQVASNPGPAPIQAPATTLAQSGDVTPTPSMPEPAPDKAVVAAAATAVAAAASSRRSERAPRGQGRAPRATEAAPTVAAFEPASDGRALDVRASDRHASDRRASGERTFEGPAPVDSVPVDAIVALPMPETTSSNPFAPATADTGDDAVESRPWPRAVLPGYGERGGYTVGFGETASSSPSFFPFEPRLSGHEAAPSTEPPPER